MKHSEYKGKILVVDDEEGIREICREALLGDGYEVIEAENGEQATKILSSVNDIDIILSDLNMPKMDGMALIEYINKYNLDVGLVVMTGFGTIESAVEVMKKGAMDFIPKPFYLSHLLLKMQQAIDRRKEKKQRERLNKLVQILKLSKDLNAKIELPSLLNEFLFHVERTFNPDGVVIFLATNGNFSAQRVSGIFRKKAQLLGELKSVLNYMKDNLKSLIFIPNKLEDIELTSKGILTDFEYQLLATPLISNSGLIGLVFLVRNKDSISFNEEDLQLLTVFASQTAAIIENSKLYGKMVEINREIIRSLAKAVEAKDSYTKGHSDQVAHYAVKLGRKLKLATTELDHLYWAGIVHDVGKIGIPDSILNKPGKLTNEEFAVMKQHPVIGREILSEVDSLKDIMPVIYHHHERIDGNGYPEGKKNGDIPFLSKIISVVDAFDAMTSDRAYRRAMDIKKAVDILQQGVNTQWSEDLVKAWISILKDEKKI